METGKAEMNTDEAAIAAGLRALRKRRWFLWGVILIYVPAIWLTLTLTGSDRKTGYVFCVWIVLVCVAVFRAAFARCPRCGNTFHMHGFIPMYLRVCLHCQLHVCADKKGRSKSLQ